MPNIDPRTINVRSLSNEQTIWHHRWITHHPSTTIPQTQVEAFARRFYTLDLPPPEHPNFVAEVPFAGSNQVTSKAKALYHHGFFQKNSEEWESLSLQQQILYRESFDNYQLDRFPLREPLIEELSLLKKAFLKEVKAYFESHAEEWNNKSRDYQLAFNKALSILHMNPMTLPTKGYLHNKHVRRVGRIVLQTAALYLVGVALLYTRQYLDNLKADYQQQLNDLENGVDAATLTSCVGTLCQNATKNLAATASKTSFFNPKVTLSTTPKAFLTKQDFSLSRLTASAMSCPKNPLWNMPVQFDNCPIDGIYPSSQLCYVPANNVTLFAKDACPIDGVCSEIPLITSETTETFTPSPSPSTTPRLSSTADPAPCFPKDAPPQGKTPPPAPNGQTFKDEAAYQAEKDSLNIKMSLLNWLSYGINVIILGNIAVRRIRNPFGP
ncbi:hypothetical protein [Simkania sp.]|uniref:hypothetical protein n=1 Tax=Simkania sp. TaxID=34094 RepID=UPI003B51B3C4